MANELSIIHTASTLSTIYAELFPIGSANMIGANGAPLPRTNVNWPTTGIFLSDAICERHYIGNAPAMAMGAYVVGYYLKLGSLPAPTDTLLGVGKLYFDGAAAADFLFDSGSGLPRSTVYGWGAVDASLDADNNPFIGTVNKLASAAIAQIVAAINITGDGDTPVDHNTGGTDAMRYEHTDTTGADDVIIKAYLKSEYDAGTRTVRGTTSTGSDGRWISPLMLNSGLIYYIVAKIAGTGETRIDTITV